MNSTLSPDRPARPNFEVPGKAFDTEDRNRAAVELWFHVRELAMTGSQHEAGRNTHRGDS